MTTNYVYDGFGHVIQESSPDTGTTSYTLDEDGNRVKETDARGIVTNRTFDKLNRVLSETYPASASENIAYTYDAISSGNFGTGPVWSGRIEHYLHRLNSNVYVTKGRTLKTSSRSP